MRREPVGDPPVHVFPDSPDPVADVAFGPSGDYSFGPAGSGAYPTGLTPVAPKAPVGEEPPLAKDQVKKRPSYLVEGDYDEVFGNADFTAPPVIGE
ncbi:hypothetical protein V5P93_001709 [Actinokineospora auranticolor]|uniref:hypothetical protein n=1 Tax=Actinokineospora auranticolor TaxID=155976 RepID=UPI000CEC921A|nr:hypothetical protein [Actinokineospora auranticolor]